PRLGRVRLEIELGAVDVGALQVTEVVDDKPTRVAGVRQLAAERAAFLGDAQLAPDAAVTGLHDGAVGEPKRWATFDQRACDLSARRPCACARAPRCV